MDQGTNERMGEGMYRGIDEVGREMYNVVDGGMEERCVKR
jgi:hypothetical protein